MKEFKIKVRLYNNLLIARREAMGLTVKQAAEAIGINYSRYSAIEGMSPHVDIMSPRRGKWTPIAEKIAVFYKCLPEDLFHDAHLAVKNNKLEMALDGADMAELAGLAVAQLPESSHDILERKDTAAAIRRALRTLTPREEGVIVRRFGLYGQEPESLESIAEDFDGRERVRQIEAKALRKLRHPTLSKPLRAAAF